MNRRQLLQTLGVKKFLLATIALVIMPSFFVLANEYELKRRVGDYSVTVRIDKNPPTRGHNNMDVLITDEAAEPVTDARVQIEYLMASLPGRAPMMKYSTEALPSDHYYSARINLLMDGVWTIILKLTRGGKADTMEFTILVR